MVPIPSRLASRLIASCTVLTCVGFAADGWTATDVVGGSVINQTWTAVGSPYNVQGDIIVPAGAYLHIEQGVTVAVSATDAEVSGIDTERVEITIRGDLDVSGTAAEPVVFQANTGGSLSHWYGIVLEAQATLAHFDHFELRHARYGLSSQPPGALVELRNGELSHNYYRAIRLDNGAALFDRMWLHDNNTQGLDVYGGAVVVTNSIFQNNGNLGIYNNGSGTNVTVINCTLYGNDEGYRTNNGATGTLTNVIVSHNARGVWGVSGTTNISYSNVWGNGTDLMGTVTEGAGMAQSNPQYVSAPGDLRLQGSSLSVDSGTANNAPDHDFDNVVRPLDGNGINGAEFDMGAFEYVATPVCGDAQQDGNEACDDGAANGTYGYCNATCTGPGPYCGDNDVNGPEQCDDGNIIPGDGCDEHCMSEGAGGSGGGGTGGTAGSGGTGAGATGGGVVGGGGSGTGGSGGSGAAHTGGGGTGGSTQVCTPGQQVACACPGGSQGVQICSASGTGYDACACTDEDDGGCSCRHAGTSPLRPALGWWWWAAMALWLARRRERAA